jgi:catechol 2,3-dioxygenase-like lactoylglutathione lyase family enzyme
MIGYVLLGTNKYETALGFYDQLLAPLGAKRAMDFGTTVIYGNGQGPMLGVCQPYDKQAATFGNGTMVALNVPSKEKVHEVYDLALKLGGKDEGPAGARSDGFYAGYFRDLDGNKICVFNTPGM